MCDYITTIYLSMSSQYLNFFHFAMRFFALWGGGARIASQQRTNRAELAGGIQEIMEADASIQEIRMMDSTHFYVYLDSDVWERSTQQERAAYCETLSERLEAQCRVNGFLGSRETLRVYYYNGDGRLLAWPADH